ncbi:hypothetical protein FRUB_04498 [Fimbriiglobus ruber]|uniref:DUF7168 domain-containing protein n=2 Tax=Fimbriiglobus ruber TaxID=1908690 RepID=A0A225DLS9_9BACT|nr:hypothetical protein FRUB_04498 [Fimbriiglobus ruber]
MRKVHELLARHNLSLDDVKGVPLEEGYAEDLTEASSRQLWQDHIWSAVAKLYFCRHFKRTGRSGIHHMVIGKPSNIAVVKYITAYLIRTGDALAKEAAAGHDSKQTFINSFRKGFACRIYGRVDEEIKNARAGKMTDSSTGRTLIVLPVYEKANRDIAGFLASHGMHPRDARSRLAISDRAGFVAGREAANTVSLATNAVGLAGVRQIAGQGGDGA